MTTPSSSVFVVILAGGSGTRFWPASRKLRPKQLLPLGPSAPLSLVKSTVQRLEGLVPPEHVFLATGEHLLTASAQELSHLPPENFFAEPIAKNTAPCIAWAAALLHKRDPNATVIVLPSDQHASDPLEFQRVLGRAVETCQSGAITTIGIVPTRPETGYGYIEVGSELSSSARRVARFVEKPNREKAEAYVASGNYLWNAGMFVFRASDMMSALERHLPAMAAGARKVASAFPGEGYREEVKAFFAETESISIDFGVMEKETNLAVVPGNFGWSDLGSWESAWELSPKDSQGNAGGSENVYVDATNNLAVDVSTAAKKKVIALVGVHDLCVIETDDALLVLPRERSQDVREVVDALKKRGDISLL